MSTKTMREAAAEAGAVLVEFEEILRRISDADLHRAIPDGGWTVAQVVSHTHLSGLLWIAAVERLRHRPELTGFREEVGHDVMGSLPASAEEAANRIASLRGALDDCLPAADPAVLGKEAEFVPLPRLTAGDLQPLIVGHLRAHLEQAREILRVRGVLSEAVGR
jgi:uncharacterized damage-inducible protein DinB